MTAAHGAHVLHKAQERVPCSCCIWALQQQRLSGVLWEGGVGLGGLAGCSMLLLHQML